MTTTVLLGWELGAGLGHASVLLTIAEALRQDGIRPVLALRDLPSVWPLLHDRNLLALPAAVPPYSAPAAFVASSYSDILAAHGFADLEVLRSVLAGWDAILATVRPDVVIAEHAPTLVLAARGRYPTTVVGSGFTVPPTHRESFPPLTDAAPLVREEHLLSVVTSALSGRGQRAPASVPDAFSTFAATPCVYPDLDAYQSTRARPARGPLAHPHAPMSTPTEDAFFAYLAADAAETEPVLLALAERLPGHAYIRGATMQMRARLAQAGIRVLDKPIPMNAALERCSLLVHHGSLETAQAGLSVGRAQLSVPRHLEQRITALRLQRLGVGTAVDGPVAVTVGSALERVGDLASAAQVVAAGLAAQGHAGSLDDVLTSVADAAMAN